MCDKDFGLLDGVLSTNDPDSALALLVQIISHIFDKHAPYCKKRIKSQSHNPWFTKEIKNELRKRDYLLKHGPRDDYKKQRNFVKTLIRSTKKSYFETLIKNNGSQKCIWNAINLLTGKKKHVNTISSLSISAEEFSSSFASTNSHSNNLSADDITKATRCTKSFCSNNLSTMTDRHIFPFMSVSDLLNYLQSLKPKKSSSFDNISVFMLKLAAPRIVSSLVYIYNLCISHSYFPTMFKRALVIPIHKKGDHNIPTNYRPISLISSLSKPFERHIYLCISRHLSQYNLLNDNQSGFRTHHSCQTALIKANEFWLNSVNNDQINGSLFIDFRQAFDVIDHAILTKKLSYYGLDITCLHLLDSFLTGREQCVLFNQVTSTTTKIKRGVPQGSVLGPLLFSLYINDLPLHIPNATCDMFADDTCVHVFDDDYESVFLKLQESANDVFQWATDNVMQIHPDKTKFMIITTRQKHQRLPSSQCSVFINGLPIEQVSSIKFLGLIVDNRLSWSSHIKTLTSTIAKATYQLARINNFINADCRKTFYHAYIHSRL